MGLPIRVLVILVVALSASESLGQQSLAERCSSLPREGTATEAAPSGKRASTAKTDRLFKVAGERYRQQNFAAALDALEESYALRPSDEVLFNMAQACREAGAETAALRLYEQVARRTTDAALRVKATRLVTELRRKKTRAEEQRMLSEQRQALTTQQALMLEQQRLIAEQQRRLDEQRTAAAQTPVSVEKTPEKKVPAYKRWWFWTVLAGAAASVAVVGGVTASAFPRDPSYPNSMMVKFQ